MLFTATVTAVGIGSIFSLNVTQRRRTEHIGRKRKAVEEIAYICCGFCTCAFLGNTTAEVSYNHVYRSEKSYNRK